MTEQVKNSSCGCAGTGMKGCRCVELYGACDCAKECSCGPECACRSGEGCGCADPADPPGA